MTNSVLALAIETVKAGYGALIFCSSRQACQSMASLVGQAMPILPGNEDEILDKREDVISHLRSLSVGLDETLGITVMQGVAFHRTFQTLEFSAFVG